MSHLAVFAFGSPRIKLDQEPVSIDRNKALALLIYLLVEGTEVSRQSLAALFWPEYDQSRALAYLRRTLWSLRDSLGNGWLNVERECVSVDSQARIWLDVSEFREMIKRCDFHGHPAAETCPVCVTLLRDAANLYQADFLEGFGLKDSPGFEEWQFFQAEKLRRELTGALERLANGYLDQKQYGSALEVAQRRLALNPLSEAGHRHLMQIYALSGERSAAIQQYEKCKHILEAELAIDPEEETQALYEKILGRGLSEPALVTSAVPRTEPAQPPAAPVFLPVQATPFVGRTDELVEIGKLLQNPACRLLTLVGAGGIGKTRLAIEAASQRALNPDAAHFSQGVYFISFASLSSDEFIVSTIGDAIRFPFRPDEPPKSQLLDYLREKHMLLLFDNFEHLIAGADLLTEILSHAPGVKILTTSRERLSLMEEWVFSVQGMTFPEDGATGSIDDFSAIKLFLQRARQVRTDFLLLPEEKPALIRICQLVQGMPLGIELAAAWVKMLSIEEIAAEIGRNLDFLTTSMRGIPERHHSLRAVFDHSWSLLTPEEQSAFNRLSVFRGDFRREAAVAVIKGPGRDGEGSVYRPSASTLPALSLLSALVDKSVLRHNTSGRYEMHELLKQFATEKLQSSLDEFEDARSRHAVYYAAFLHKLEDDLRGGNQLDAIQQIEEEVEDIRAAWNWIVAHEMLLELEQASLGLALFFDIRSRLHDGLEFFSLAAEWLREMRRSGDVFSYSETELDGLFAFCLSRQSWFAASLGQWQAATKLIREGIETIGRLNVRGDRSSEQRAHASVMLRFGAFVSDPTDVQQLYQESIETFRSTGNSWGIAMSDLVIGDFFEYALNDAARARQIREESLEIFESLNNHWGKALCLNDLAAMYYGAGDYARAEELSLRSLQISKELGDPWGTLGCYLNLGQVATARGEYDRAKQYYQISMKFARETGNVDVTAVHLDCIGYIHMLTGEVEQAEEMFSESLALNRANSNHRGAGMALVNLGDVARARGSQEQARKLYQDALALFDENQPSWEMAVCQKKLGILACEINDTSSARILLHRALHHAYTISRIPEVLDVMIGLAELQAKERQYEAALDLLSFVVQQPALAREARGHAEELLKHLSSYCKEAQLTRIQQRCQDTNLSRRVEILLGKDAGTAINRSENQSRQK